MKHTTAVISLLWVIIAILLGTLGLFIFWWMPFPHTENALTKTINAFSPLVVMISGPEGILGTGTIIDPATWLILTSKHLFSANTQYSLRTQWDRVYQYVPSVSDGTRDLALGHIQPDEAVKRLPKASFRSQNSLRVGDSVYSFGAVPLIQSMTFSPGIITALAQKVPLGDGDFGYFIQTDVKAQNGFSGGPLVDSRWFIIGVNTAVYGSWAGISWSTPVTQNIVQELTLQIN